MDKITMFSAGYGDTFLVSINSEEEGLIHILIDCGFGYKNEIRPIISKLDKLKRFIITHYDKDHIQGAYNFLKENGNRKETQLVAIDQIWLNTYRHIQIIKGTTELSEIDKVKINAFKSECESLIYSAEAEAEEEIGAEQAVSVGSKIIENGYLWNNDFNGLAANVENKSHIPITSDVSLVLLSPTREKLEKLEYEFKKAIFNLLSITEIPENKLFDDAFELFVQKTGYIVQNNREESISARREVLSGSNIEELSKPKLYTPDSSKANGSSIAFVLETKNKKLLFLADAHSELIEEQLILNYPQCEEEPVLFDAIKVSHHGAQGNNSPNLFKLIDSEKFLISTNGKHPSGHKHPDTETIARIVNRPIPNKRFKRKLYFNYDLDHIKGFKVKELQDHYNYSIIVSNEIEI